MLDELRRDRKNDSCLLLHLSDIHFQEPYCLNPETDQEHPVRMAMLNDIRDMVKKIGKIDAILVSGDIAFKGHPEEYKAAASWLSDVTSIAGCCQSDIYTVPGNHDVNRTIAGSRAVQSARNYILSRSTTVVTRDKELHDTLLDDQLGLALISPMEQYNVFAASFGCDFIQCRPFWVSKLPLALGWSLRIHGLTTTLFSGPDDDKPRDLHVGALQHVFPPEDGIISIAMMHHPPDWLFDNDELNDDLWNHCALHLVGHKHRRRYRCDANGIRLVAGAVNPSRLEANWVPSYNLIRLQVIEIDSKHFLKIESYMHSWQDDPPRFVAIRTTDDKDVFVHNVSLRQQPLQAEHGQIEQLNEQLPSEEVPGIVDELKEVSDMSNPQRDLVYNFWQLTPSERRKIMQNLGLLDSADDQLPETQRYRLAFAKARERGMINELKNEIGKLSVQ